MRGSAWAAAACMFVTLSAVGQYLQRPADVRPRFEANRLHPVPVLLEGQFDLGWVRDPVADALAEAGGEQAPRLRGLSRSFLRLSGNEVLSGGNMAHFRLEHSFRPADGRALDDQRFWDAEATVGFSSAQGWRLDLGRREQPAWGVVLRADPWAGNTVASPDRWLYAPSLGLERLAEGGDAPSPAGPDRRSDDSVTLSVPWRSPGRPAWVLELQSGRTRDADALRGGASLRFERGVWFAGAGYQKWSNDARSVPLAAGRTFDNWTLSAVHTRGRAIDRDGALVRFDGTMLAGSRDVFGTGDPRRRQWRVALSSLGIRDAPRQWKLGAGYRHHLAGRTWLQVNAARALAADWSRDGRVTGHWLIDAGLVVGFARDLRLPQEPW